MTEGTIRQASQRVLITGGTGLIGARLLRLLCARDWSVTSLQRAPGHLVGVEETLHLPYWTPDGIRAVLTGKQFDRVFHLASYGVLPSERDMQTSFRINLDCLRALVEGCTVSSSNAIVIAGTCAEYKGSNIHAPIREDAPLTFASLYGASKAAGTLAALAIANARGARCIAVRLFGVFGPGERAHRLLPTLVAHLRRGRRVPLSDGEQIRDFLHVDDAASGLLALSDAAIQSGVLVQTVVNLCSGQPVTVRRFAKTVADLMEVPHVLLGFGDLPRRTDEIPYLVGDITALRSLTRWVPAYDLVDGLRISLSQTSTGTRSLNMQP